MGDAVDVLVLRAELRWVWFSSRRPRAHFRGLKGARTRAHQSRFPTRLQPRHARLLIEADDGARVLMLFSWPSIQDKPPGIAPSTARRGSARARELVTVAVPSPLSHVVVADPSTISAQGARRRQPTCRG